ncbi:MAG: aldo/keto reductase [Pseudomonadales bacterium]
MLMRTLGATGIMVSPLGLGTVKLGRDQAVKYPKAFAIPDDQAAHKLLQRARELGINLLDTAPAYGNSEQRLGELLKRDTQDWVICSKVGEEFIDGQSHFDFTPEHTRTSVLRSLKRLQRDYLDIVLVHSDGNDIAIVEQYGTLQTLADLKQQGLIRAIGFSGKTLEGGLRAAEVADVMMVTYNPEYRDEAALLDYCASHNKGVLIKKALASGHIGDDVGASLRFALQHPATSSVMVGTINPEHLAANAAAIKDS